MPGPSWTEKRWISKMVPVPPAAGVRWPSLGWEEGVGSNSSDTVLGALDNVLLQHPVDGGEEDAEARHANNQVPVVLRVALGVAQNGRVDDVELHVLSAKLEVGPDQGHQILK